MKKNDLIEIAGSKDVYRKIEPDVSLELKKALLEMEAADISMQMISERFREKSKEEMGERALAKRSMRELVERLNVLLENLPKSTEIPSEIKHQIKEAERQEMARVSESTTPAIKAKRTHESSLKNQLEEIRKKISSLKG